jgi:hypothetical protein
MLANASIHFQLVFNIMEWTPPNSNGIEVP